MAATTLLTSDQFLALPLEFDQHGNRIKDELIGGEVVKVAFPSLPHDLTKNRINAILMRYLDQHPELRLLSLVEIGTQVSDYDAFMPDVSVVNRGALAAGERIFHGAPEIAIDVVSPTDTAKHLKRKVDAYLEGGAKSVWIVYPEARAVIVHAQDSMREWKANQRIEDPLLPGFSAPVASFFDLT
ncbi:MAG TPA: Uma2 family endonuclease [Bryobacteraceae bacterium]|nr:Uma2 family endonuclease [Bryobacteraceae bacterium]